MFDSSPLIQNSKLKTQNSIISFRYVDSYAKIFLILYPPLENSTTHIAIAGSHFYGTEYEIWDDFGPVGNTEKNIGLIMSSF
jgi:hypothetical protein